MDYRQYSRKQLINFLTKILIVDQIRLAGILGVTEQSLNYWVKKGNKYSKSHRIINLFKVVNYITTRYPKIEKKEIKSILENSRITIDPNDSEYGDISLLNYTIECFELSAYSSIVDQTIADFLVLKKCG